ncbi:uncharacterized protein UV8b_02569 [Ustilaginoidea virens]|uniref:Sphingomyelinase family n=1 Tax=Ustilaginoidea virens TaxID=1159556 RepID=A0A8E5HN26_USTVR|nr:uncharacterized protein UV8b_02569 [Ustilaginoidea virens]QUC18328.1 hypothetical protein UV8b_02569 [Ustilaginoidea virens]
MSLFVWCSRRVGALSIIALTALSFWVVSQEAGAERPFGQLSDNMRVEESSVTPLQKLSGIGARVFAYYSLLVHLLVFVFPVRACWSVWTIAKLLRRDAQSRAIMEYKRRNRRRRISLTSDSSSDTVVFDTPPSDSTACSPAVSETSDSDLENYTDSTDYSDHLVAHAVIIPNYKEDMDTLRETLDVLASHSQAEYSYDVYLGMEQREHEAESKALRLIQDFAKKFRSIDFTMHPADIPGEAAGKGSNLA